ncbi:MAG: nucleoside triphosphate pyrophosphohydrolase [Gammaproteobacteria bacterium]|nr:nucleoside triphosphate pyrophosphohydrolase [Gammaproteobacteria bacterium]MDH5728583.1 nucleoside triphosphate pyrophosphohydrolase [Gammaproteobacteria bacterium]
MNKHYELSDLLTLMRSLRDREKGCPWDQVQTHESLKPFLVEEAYEVLAAIDSEQSHLLCEELGDLLFQIIFHSQIATENSLFCFDDIVHTITEKMIRRHPHVFADVRYATIEEQKQAWADIKAEEKRAKGLDTNESLLDSISHALPPLRRAQELQHQAATIGFDWQHLSPVVEKLKEELAELEAAIADKNEKNISEELGDVLFSVVNLSRHLKKDADVSLSAANEKFVTRFNKMELRAKHLGVSMQTMDEQALDELWHYAKSDE